MILTSCTPAATATPVAPAAPTAVPPAGATAVPPAGATAVTPTQAAAANPGLQMDSAKVAAQYFNDADYAASLAQMKMAPLNP